jgi:peptidoglycan/xylan/chitin deacetylase (PgdA/CDA1 family)
MRITTLEYHDVVDGGAWDKTGFPGAAADSYKLSVTAFERHMDAVNAAGAHCEADVVTLLGEQGPVQPKPVLLTFDDGGVSAITTIAPVLESRGWRGHFFVATDYIGSSGFLARTQLRELRQRGHIVGTHSCSHPLRMSRLSDAELSREWNESIARLADILGEPIVVGSVPGGALSDSVVSAAAKAGIRALFTSEPVVRTKCIGECTVVGRFTIRDNTTSEIVGRIAAGNPLPRMRQWARWNALKVAKATGGPSYLVLRGWMMARRHRVAE